MVKGYICGPFVKRSFSMLNNSPWSKAREGLGTSAVLHQGDRTIQRVLRISVKILRALSSDDALFLVGRAFSVVQG